MAFEPGKSTYVAIGTSGSETNITAYTSKVKVGRSVAKNDTTTFGVSDEQSVPGVKANTVAFTVKYDPTVYTTLQALLGVASKSIVIGPRGNTATYPKISAGGYLSKMDWAGDPGSAEELDCEFTVSGAVTDGTF